MRGYKVVDRLVLANLIRVCANPSAEWQQGVQEQDGDRDNALFRVGLFGPREWEGWGAGHCWLMSVHWDLSLIPGSIGEMLKTRPLFLS